MKDAIKPTRKRSRTDVLGARLHLAIGTTAWFLFVCWSPAVFAGADEATANAPIAAALLPSDLSPWGMFLSADVFVKAVMVGLAFASFVTWTVALAKGIELALAARNLTSQIGALARASTIADVARAFKGQGELEAAALEAQLEMEASANLDAGGVKERVLSRLERVEAQAGRRMARAMGAFAVALSEPAKTAGDQQMNRNHAVVPIARCRRAPNTSVRDRSPVGSIASVIAPAIE